MTYSAVGLPAGITYDALSGELAGTATEVGEYPVAFTATDTATGHVLTYSRDFLVLPPNGGDATGLSVNFWITKMKTRTGEPGSGAWKAAAGASPAHCAKASIAVATGIPPACACRPNAAGLVEVRLVHGRGKGVQRAAVQRVLAGHPRVAGFWDAPESHLGATIVRLRPDRAGV